MRGYLLTAAALALAACAGNLRADSFDPGAAPPAQFQRDSALCEMEGEKNRSTGGYGGLIAVSLYYETFNKVYDACMRSKGYARRQAG